MSSNNGSWRYEKACNIVSHMCWLIRHTKSIQHDLHAPDGTDIGGDMRNDFYSILSDGLKLVCDAYGEMGGAGVGESWSPDLVKYLYTHPDRWEETLKIISSADYRDGYFDDKSEF